MLTGRKYRLELTTEQAVMCEEFGNICRAVWNTALRKAAGPHGPRAG